MDPLTAWLLFAVVVLLFVYALAPRRRPTRSELLRRRYYDALAQMHLAVSRHDAERTVRNFRHRRR